MSFAVPNAIRHGPFTPTRTQATPTESEQPRALGFARTLVAGHRLWIIVALAGVAWDWRCPMGLSHGSPTAFLDLV